MLANHCRTKGHQALFVSTKILVKVSSYGDQVTWEAVEIVLVHIAESGCRLGVKLCLGSSFRANWVLMC